MLIPTVILLLDHHCSRSYRYYRNPNTKTPAWRGVFIWGLFLCLLAYSLSYSLNVATCSEAMHTTAVITDSSVENRDTDDPDYYLTVKLYDNTEVDICDNRRSLYDVSDRTASFSLPEDKFFWNTHGRPSCAAE